MRPQVSRSQNRQPILDIGAARPRSSKRSFIGRLLAGLTGASDSVDPKRGRLLLESLENRQMMAGDVEFMFTESGAGDTQAVAVSESGNGLVGQPEGMTHVRVFGLP